MKSSEGSKLLDMLGLARRAGELIIGQDKIFDALRKGKKLAVFVTNDCSKNVLRTLETAEGRGGITVLLLKDTDRARLGNSLGLRAAQAAALPSESGFVRKSFLLNEDRSDADE
ncbi:MAG: ribosomal L7Ae/L30e/S12e/Gadd45 family protein [Synergistaceae bacterium]|nr:ribosomal L7Ae/L30e/S12e/Gadd45 family protein [Synergistaceae bacterium]